MVDRKWIEEEREGWKKISDSKCPENVREHARTLIAVLDEVLEKRDREVWG